MELVRIDKWLWAARFYKTRSAATDAVLGGRVHLNDARVKPSKEIKAGDVVEVKIGQLQWTVVVRGISAKRGPASVKTWCHIGQARKWPGSSETEMRDPSRSFGR